LDFIGASRAVKHWRQLASVRINGSPAAGEDEQPKSSQARRGIVAINLHPLPRRRLMGTVGGIGCSSTTPSCWSFDRVGEREGLTSLVKIGRGKIGMDLGWAEGRRDWPWECHHRLKRAAIGSWKAHSHRHSDKVGSRLATIIGMIYKEENTIFTMQVQSHFLAIFE
jgi:hypothetical protein